MADAAACADEEEVLARREGVAFKERLQSRDTDERERGGLREGERARLARELVQRDAHGAREGAAPQRDGPEDLRRRAA